ncbi:MAG: hypothetical protein ACK5YV_07930 [Betaproteobacteria bacterium]|jgi:hypothetical protein
MSNLPAVREQRAFSLTDMRDMAGALAESKLFGIQTPQQAYALMLIADAEGLHPASVAQDYDVIQGRPARKTHSVLARFQQAGGSVQWHDFTEQVVSGTFSHPKGGSVRIEWNLDMAARAGLLNKDNWKRTPRAMLRARCIAEGVRATFPAALGGAIVTEEAQDLDVVATQSDGTTVVQPPAGPTVARKPRPSAAPAPADVVDATPATSAGASAEENAAVTAPVQAAAPAPSGDRMVGQGEIAYLGNKARSIGADLAEVAAAVGLHGVVIEAGKLSKADFDTVKAELLKRGA